ncbi:type II CAAX endopeptidase family protein [Duncaniella dubosii]|uniref:CPBP family intramembrane metalloprotease n=1 Tax=Duncaniella dubosii TaxID=2518971 RepID=A0A4P7W6I0_9BACT|nr:type II CAAX endopeptidase family protein [Duncaniella dubosii]QCD43170.1 CPBP family intramembrane metalloprotease [Duncaniella dubosii]
MNNSKSDSNIQPEFINLRFLPGQRIIVLIVALCLFSIFGSVIIGLIMRNGVSAQSLRISTILQDCIIFILPAIVSALLISQYPARFLGIERRFTLMQIILAIAAMLMSIPAMNALVVLNENMTLPSIFSELERWMREAEEQAQSSVSILLGNQGIGSLIVNILIVGVLAGFSEELFFRGALQRILFSCKINPHGAIWITAIVFSAFHLQFFGFFPRLILGAYFGYLFYWSKSLWLPIILHVFNNSLVVFTLWYKNLTGIPESETINHLGGDSPMQVITSIILTAFLLKCLFRYSMVSKDDAKNNIVNND